MEQSITILLSPENREISVTPGETVRDALIKSGIFLNDYCGGKGTCGKCRIRFLEHAPSPSDPDRKFLSTGELEQGFRLACTACPEKDASISIPEESLRKETKIMLGEISLEQKPDSDLKKVNRKLEPATLERQLGDLDLVRDSLEMSSLEPDPAFLKKLPHVMRSSDYHVALTLFDGKLVDIEPARAALPPLGAAFDLGTTTVAGTLFQLDSGKALAREGRLNPQSPYGADVISRIQFASQSPQNLETLRSVIADCINEILTELCSSSGIAIDQVGYITLAGNTTMQHLFLGVSPDFLPTAPYVPVFRDRLLMHAREAGIRTHPGARLFVFPAIGGFVGGDTVSDLLVAGLSRSNELSLLVDIGTNGEIVLGNADRILATSAAAGPAFEGRNISCGMRAEPGAVDRVMIGEDLFPHTIDDKPAVGICGSGLIDLVSELLNLGMIDVSGRFNPDGSRENRAISRRFEKTDQGYRLLLAEKERGAGRDIFLLQSDIRELQLAKGAIATAVQLLLKEYGAEVGDIEKIYVAGAFGNYISPEAALKIGLLPGVGEGKIHFIGNAALAGAAHALLSGDLRMRAGEIAGNVEFIELAGRKDFQDVFAESMLFIS